MMYEILLVRGVPFQKIRMSWIFRDVIWCIIRFHRGWMYLVLVLTLASHPVKIWLIGTKVGWNNDRKRMPFMKRMGFVHWCFSSDGKFICFIKPMEMEKMMQSVMLCQLMVSTLIATRVIRFSSDGWLELWTGYWCWSLWIQWKVFSLFCNSWQGF